MRDGRTDEQLKIELLSQWKLEAEFRNFLQLITRIRIYNQSELKVARNGRYSLQCFAAKLLHIFTLISYYKGRPSAASPPFNLAATVVVRSK